MKTKFDTHFATSDIDRLSVLAGRLPQPFFFGTATAGYQVEGGYNGEGQPQTNWTFLERAGKVETSGPACRFFEHAEADFNTMQKMGLNMFRMSLEWARIQPGLSRDERPSEPPPFDAAAIEKYAELVASMRRRGLEPLITLHHFVHPLWAGLDLWLDRERVDGLFVPYVEHAVRQLNQLLVHRFGERPVRYWITLNETNLLAGAMYTVGRFPHHAKLSMGNTIKAAANLLHAHCMAYDALHRIYREERWEAPMVSLNVNSNVVYHLDKFYFDLLSLREMGVARSDVAAFLDASRATWGESMRKIEPPQIALRPLRIGVEKAIAWWLRVLCTPERFQSVVDTVYASEFPRKLDFLSIDYYDPFVRSQLGLPAKGERLLNGRPNLLADLSNQVLNPVGLRQFLAAYQQGHARKPILIAESGMCHRWENDGCQPRNDGATRDTFLRAYLFEVLQALNDDIPLLGYLHWSYCDNYEWGSYKPRFGLFRTDFANGSRRHSLDASGSNAAGAYATIVQALRFGERHDVRQALMRSSYPLIATE